MTPPEYVIVGRIRKPHGLRGEVIVEPITDAPAAVFAAGRRVYVGTVDGDMPPAAPMLTVETARELPGGVLLARFEHIGDRIEAELWRDRFLLLPMDEIEPPGDGDAFLHELVGMRVEQTSGEEIGEVVDVFELPQGIAVDVRWRGRLLTLSLADPFLRDLDRERRRIVLELPEGLLE
ncbi:MAG: ribosome maturation factor RimM [Gemmatimonadota bacterium]|nr:ribosome maturation factor RimM [Gemmatimonadota bacterium]